MISIGGLVVSVFDWIADRKAKRMDKTVNPKIHMLPAKAYPVTIRILSRHGHELWHKVVEKSADGIQALEIPGYADTDHVPVKMVIEYADGTQVEK